MKKRREPRQSEAREASRRERTLLCMTDCESEAQRRYARRSSFSGFVVTRAKDHLPR